MDGAAASKPGALISENAVLALTPDVDTHVSRGALKLDADAGLLVQEETWKNEKYTYEAC